MPAWWKGRLKGKLKESSKTSVASEPSLSRPAWAEEEEDVECSLTPAYRREVRKGKASSFDGVLVGRTAAENSSSRRGDESESTFAFRHPLPLPSASSPLPSPPPMGSDMAITSGFASASSLSSSGSSDGTPDLGFYRFSDPLNMTRGRHASPDPRRHQHGDRRRRLSCSPVVEHPRNYKLPVSPNREIHSSSVRCQETLSNTKAVSREPSTRGSSRTSPIHPVSLCVHPALPSGRQEDLRSPLHPLPLPPNSPTSPSSLTYNSPQVRWKKGKLLGRGTFGHVFLGFNSENGQMCAIKEVSTISDDSISRESLKQLNQEINLLSQLSHPNIVQYYGSELVDETLSVYLEYVSGGSIHKLLQEYGPFGEPIIKNYTAQILSGLAYLHMRNTVHRDIKGANILVDPNGEVKLADFGMAKHISSYTSIRSFKGSPYWMAPEIIMNVSGYNLSVDIWSLGCTILEMATSKPPWSQFEGVAAIFKIGNSKDIPDIPEHLSFEAKSFLRLCLLRDPSTRPTAIQLMNHPFVYDQPAIKATKLSMTKDMIPSSSDGSFSMNKGVHINGNASPLSGLGHPLADPTQKNTSDLTSTRTNMSLPVSPCSSPLRLFRQSNRSCFPSPSHVALSAGAGAAGPNNFSYQVRPSHYFPGHSFDTSDLKTQAQYFQRKR